MPAHVLDHCESLLELQEVGTRTRGSEVHDNGRNKNAQNEALTSLREITNFD